MTMHVNEGIDGTVWNWRRLVATQTEGPDRRTTVTEHSDVGPDRYEPSSVYERQVTPSRLTFVLLISVPFR